ncbi:MAG: thiamine phosphate synthase [Chloroflexi bacterium]|nr:thiamine phosphate synthase [Chloroflexota bacterium]MYK61010.1 thiamine phosphate synthase [Chloroflexota bacterium]
MTLRPAASKIVGGIYVIVDPDHCGGRDIFMIAEATASAGAAVIQLRHKQAPEAVITDEATTIAQICRANDTLFIVNDSPFIAAEVGADGVHVGQGDLPVAECRIILQPHQIVGKSNALIDEAITSFNEGADYIAVGSIFTTTTKSDTRPAGLATLHAVVDCVTAPIVAIGGIKASNIAAVAQAGADSACVATAVTMAQDPAAATRELVERFGEARAVT